MKSILSFSFLLTDRPDRFATFLILALFVLCPLHTALADNIYQSGFVSTSSQYNNVHYSSAISNEDRDQRMQSLRDFAKTQLPRLLPGLPGEVRQPLEWAMSNVKEGQNLFKLDLSTDDTQPKVPGSPLGNNPFAPAQPDDLRTLLATSYHHHNGVLPLHDALIMGGHAERSFFGDYLHGDFHPYYGQNYFSAHHYYGADLKLNFAKSADTRHGSKPWGSISIGYTQGESKLMDHGKGVNLLGTINFTDELSLNSGIHQNDTGVSGNYILLQWKISTD